MQREHRVLFDRVADLYDRARPTYPPHIFDDLVQPTALPPAARVLEIGCGTGQATAPLAERGFRVVAVELGEQLAAIARRNLASFANVEVQNAAFETWPLPPEPFDMVFAASSFHWLDHDVALPKIAAALRPRGMLAIFDGGHVAGGSDDFFHEAQRCYEAHMPATPPGLRLQHPDERPLEFDLATQSGLFEIIALRRYVWLRDFTTQTYIDEISTYSGHIALSPDDRAALLACISELLDRGYGGAITKAYMTDLKIARIKE